MDKTNYTSSKLQEQLLVTGPIILPSEPNISNDCRASSTRSSCMDIEQATSTSEGPLNVHVYNCGWNVRSRRRSWKVGAPRHHIPGNYLPRSVCFSDEREQSLISSPPLVQFMKYVVPAVLAFLTLRYQGKTDSLFRENPAPVWCFLAATCVFWLIVGAVKQMTTIDAKRLQTLTHTALASGILSAISLVSIFLTYPVSLLPLIGWIPLPLVLAWQRAYSMVHRGLTTLFNKIHAILVWARGLGATEEASLPV